MEIKNKDTNMLSQAVQDYLKTIYKLQEKGLVSTTEISKELKVSGASVTGMLKRLDTMGMVDYNSYKGVKLTAAGNKIALEILRHHRLLELYLKDIMGFTLDKVHDEACRLEHHISDEFSDKINSILGNPMFDPHGHPIPTKDGKIPDINTVPLSEIMPNQNVIIRRLADTDSKLLAYLEQLELIPNTELTVLDKAPFSGPITINYNNKREILGNEVSRNIYVEII